MSPGLVSNLLVSVPLRGKYRGELLVLNLLESSANLVVSVPLRGKYRGEYWAVEIKYHG